MAQVRADTRIILVAYAAWLHSGFGFATFRFGFRNGSSSSRHSDHLVAYAAWLHSGFGFRYVSNFVCQVRADTRIILVAYAAWLHSGFGFATFRFSFWNGSSSSRYSDHFGRVCCVVAFRTRFRYVSNGFYEWRKFRSFWSHMLRGCVPDSVSRRFEFSFMNGSSLEPILGSFWSRMPRGRVPDSVSLRFEFSFMRLKFRAVLGSFWCCYACRKTGTGKPSSTSSLMCEAAACLNA